MFSDLIRLVFVCCVTNFLLGCSYYSHYKDYYVEETCAESGMSFVGASMGSGFSSGSIIGVGGSFGMLGIQNLNQIFCKMPANESERTDVKRFRESAISKAHYNKIVTWQRVGWITSVISYGAVASFGVASFLGRVGPERSEIKVLIPIIGPVISSFGARDSLPWLFLTSSVLQLGGAALVLFNQPEENEKIIAVIPTIHPGGLGGALAFSF